MVGTKFEFLFDRHFKQIVFLVDLGFQLFDHEFIEQLFE